MKTLLFFLLFFLLFLGTTWAAPIVTSSGEKLVSLNLERVETPQVVKLLAPLGGYDLISDDNLHGTVTVRIKNKDIFEALDLIFKAIGQPYRRIKNCLLIISREKLADKLFFRQKVFSLNYLSAPELKDLIKPVLKENEVVSAGSQNQNLIVLAEEQTLKDIEEIIKNLDTPSPQIALEAKIIEVSSDLLKNFGFEWPQKLAASVTVSKNLTATVDPLKFSATLNLLEQKGLSRVLASPRLVVLDNREAYILIGDRIPYPVTSVSPSGAVSSRVEFVEAGIKLKITPRINNNEEITVLIAPEVSYVYNWKGPSNEIPWVKTRETKTLVRVKNGQTILIAGLLSDDEKEAISRLPIFGQVPILGDLFFSTKRKDKTKSEVIISVTPQIVGI